MFNKYIERLPDIYRLTCIKHSSPKKILDNFIYLGDKYIRIWTGRVVFKFLEAINKGLTVRGVLTSASVSSYLWGRLCLYWAGPAQVPGTQGSPGNGHAATSHLLIPPWTGAYSILANIYVFQGHQICSFRVYLDRMNLPSPTMLFFFKLLIFYSILIQNSTIFATHFFHEFLSETI